jgi:hypothetical protein
MRRTGLRPEGCCGRAGRGDGDAHHANSGTSSALSEASAGACRAASPSGSWNLAPSARAWASGAGADLRGGMFPRQQRLDGLAGVHFVIERARVRGFRLGCAGLAGVTLRGARRAHRSRRPALPRPAWWTGWRRSAPRHGRRPSGRRGRWRGSAPWRGGRRPGAWPTWFSSSPRKPSARAISAPSDMRRMMPMAGSRHALVVDALTSIGGGDAAVGDGDAACQPSTADVLAALDLLGGLQHDLAAEAGGVGGGAIDLGVAGDGR